MPDSIFVTHARSLDELRLEFTSDLRRRLAALDLEAKFEKRVARSAAIERAKIELESALAYWQSVELRGAKRQRPAAEPAAEPASSTQ